MYNESKNCFLYILGVFCVVICYYVRKIFMRWCIIVCGIDGKDIGIKRCGIVYL